MTDSTSDDNQNIDIIEFIQLLNKAVRDKRVSEVELPNSNDLTELVNDGETYTLRLCRLLNKIELLTTNHDPENYKNCRFGNTAFSTWLEEVTQMCDQLFLECKIEIQSEIYENAKKRFLNSFGNKTRIDYGTGHELEFVYFLKDLYTCKLVSENELDSIVLVLLNRYFEFVRRLLERYTLEPAGSKGAWGVDDYQFLPFIFGSSQLVSSTIDTSDCLELGFVTKYKDDYLFMRAMEYKIKMIKGVPIEIGSPMICNILTSCTWEKINNGLFQLYINDVQRLTAKKVVTR
ncbi:phosphotyrosyl phosphatase activator protein [Theileria orientalis]|uniref:Serine/threonine-protein phosphatase 2A activator n=1 Tax=Theileria orientalis TaxID=68886 RepID=A0A976SIG1_THEOR|nr:phosphotyrosyl phosphatase activator protein [Theileria orientalis]